VGCFSPALFDFILFLYSVRVASVSGSCSAYSSNSSACNLLKFGFIFRNLRHIKCQIIEELTVQLKLKAKKHIHLEQRKTWHKVPWWKSYRFVWKLQAAADWRKKRQRKFSGNVKTQQITTMENLNFARTPQFLRKVISEARR